MRSSLREIDPAAAVDMEACRTALRGGSRTFFAASYLLPRSVSDPATALYAFCRLADDAVDLAGGKTAALLHLRERLERAYAGRPFPILRIALSPMLSIFSLFRVHFLKRCWKGLLGMPKGADTKIFPR